MIPQMVAALATGIFFGAALYINLVEHPARISCGVPLAVTEWRPSYKRGTMMQAPLALIGSLSALTVWWWSEGGAAWLIGGLLLLLVVPFTLVVILPTSKRLETQELDLRSEEAGRLLRRWGRLHAIRSTPQLRLPSCLVLTTMVTVRFAIFSSPFVYYWEKEKNGFIPMTLLIPRLYRRFNPCVYKGWRRGWDSNEPARAQRLEQSPRPSVSPLHHFTRKWRRGWDSNEPARAQRLEQSPRPSVSPLHHFTRKWRRGWDSSPSNQSSPVVHCRLETCINKGDLRFEDLGSSEAAILKSQIRGGK
jgi:hypothetical protein